MRDIRRYGPAIVRELFPHGAADKTVTLRPRETGPIEVRLRGSDIPCVRYVCDEAPQDLGGMPALEALFEARYRSLLDAGAVPVIVDLGANIGVTALWYARRWPQARIVAVEPDPDNFALLVRNCAQQPRIQPIQAGIASEPGHAAIVAGGDWATQTERSDRGVVLVTMDQVAGDGELFLVKVNIEGFEKDLFAANTGWIGRTFAILVEPHDWLRPGQRVTRALQQAMAAEDFEFVIRKDFLLYYRPPSAE